MFESILHYDTSLLIWSRTLISENSALYVQIFAESIVLFVMIYLISLWIYGVRQRDDAPKISALNIFYLIMLVFIVYGVINLGVPQWRPSPDEVAGGIKPLIPHPIGNSFPSGHALFSGAFIVALFMYTPKKILILSAIIVSLMTCGLRVIGGVHYPGDIVGGYTFGILSALILQRAVHTSLFQKKLTPFFIQLGKRMGL